MIGGWWKKHGAGLQKLSVACLILSLLTATSFADPRDFKVNVTPVFSGTFSWPSSPIAVAIENKGPDAVGEIQCAANGANTRYPIELPTGARKRVLIYQSALGYGMPLELRVVTNRGRLTIPYSEPSFQSAKRVMALISDNPGDMGFLRSVPATNKSNSEISVGDVYCSPEDAPERPIAYEELAAVILGEGSDRLSDGAVSAIKLYALTGGTVIHLGGASARTLSDPRWAGFVPLSSLKTVKLKPEKVLSKAGNTPFSNSVTVAAGVAAADASTLYEGDVPIISERAYGLGRSVVFAFNPFEEAFAGWTGRGKLLTTYSTSLRAQLFANSFEGQHDYSGLSTSDTSAFSIKLPESSKVFWTLAAFFLVVVPINFIVLRKLGKGEFAWFTAPLISLTFAGIFLSQASQLYSQELSSQTTGAMIMHEGSPEAMFIGNSQMFFPTGGTYDLKLTNIDKIVPQWMTYEATLDVSPLSPVDIGTMQIPDLQVNNLAFEEFSYRQRVSPYTGLSIVGQFEKGALQSVRLKNAGAQNLENASVMVKGLTYAVGTLGAGKDKTIALTKDKPKPDGNFLRTLTQQNLIVVFISDVFAPEIGPQLGGKVQVSGAMRLIYVTPIKKLGT